MQVRPVTFDAFSVGWETQKKHLGVYALALFLFCLLAIVATLPVFPLNMSMQKEAQEAALAGDPFAQFKMPMYWVSQLLQTVLSCLIMPFGVGISAMALNSMRGQAPQIGDMFNLKGRYMPLVVMSLIAALLGWIGTVMCCIPGLIVYALLMPAGLLVLDKGLQPMEAIKKCFNDLTPSLGALLGVFLVCVVMMALGFALCGIGFLFLGPVYFCSQAAVYRMAGYDDHEFATVQPTDYYRAP